jgi:hypothetical protein
MKKILFLLTFFLIPLITFGSEFSPNVLIESINTEREAMGLRALVEDPRLSYAALSKAEELADIGYLVHSLAEQGTAWAVLENVGYTYLYAGENLGVGQVTEKEIFERWMNSPTHKENIINSFFTEVGIGVINGKFGGKDVLYIVSYFAKPKSEKITQGASDSKKIRILKNLISVLLAQIQVLEANASK